MLQPVGGVSHVRVVYPLQAMRSDPTVLTHFAAERRDQAARRRHAAHLRAAPAGAVGRARCRGDPQTAVRRLADRDGVRRPPRSFRHARRRGPARVPRRARGADQHAGTRRDAAHAQSRGDGVPQRDPRAAGGAQFPRPAGADAVLRRAEPRARLGAADAGAERGGGEGGRAAALLAWCTIRASSTRCTRRTSSSRRPATTTPIWRCSASARSRSCRWATRRSTAPSRT